MSEKMKVIFAPGCFDDFEGSQEDLDNLIAEVTKMAEDGTLLENSVEVDEFDDDDFVDDDLYVQHMFGSNRSIQ